MEGSGMTSDREQQRRREGVIFLVLFALTIPAANWLIGHVGTTCIANGPCVVPVAPGLMAPSGVMMVGFALVLRDLVQRRLGAMMSALAILCGTGLSAMMAPPSLVLASGVAFLLFATWFTNASGWMLELTTLNRATLHLAPLVVVLGALLWRELAKETQPVAPVAPATA